MGGCSWLWHLSSQKTTMHTETLLSRKWLDICLLMGSSEWIPLFALRVCAAFAFSVKLPLFWFTSCLDFLLFSPHPMGEEWEKAGCVFGSWLGTTHHRPFCTFIPRECVFEVWIQLSKLLSGFACQFNVDFYLHIARYKISLELNLVKSSQL